MNTNDIKKGMRVLLQNGWYATMQDSKKGNIRMATVEGIYTETGSIYAWDIKAVRPDANEPQNWANVTLNEKQLAQMQLVKAAGF